LNDTAKVQIKFEKRTFGDVYFGNEAFSYDVSGLFFLMTYASSFMIAKNINPTLFDLSGRKVLVPQKGHIYIMGNKKVVW